MVADRSRALRVLDSRRNRETGAYDFVLLRLARPTPEIGARAGTAGYRCHVLSTAMVIDEVRIASVCAVLRASLTRREGGMVTMVTRWTGLETRVLRVAMRMSVREFARHLPVSDRMVSKWEAGGMDMYPGTQNQDLLDVCLTRASLAARQRFTGMLEAMFEALSIPQTDRPQVPEPGSSPESAAAKVRHEVHPDGLIQP